MCEFARARRMGFMTPETNASPTEVNPQIGGNGFGLATRHVCPFCGTILEKQEGPCPRCALEDTEQTRQSTRSRLGPWYVLQMRNPYAPGMKYNTLLALIRRGQVSAKTVIRGPTTQQFWRFAGRVKGISREFGICWSCGTSVQMAPGNCPRCGKSQELPANPDALLEGEAPAKTLFVDISPKSAGVTQGNPLPEATAAPAQAAEMPGFEIRGARPGIPSPAATMAINAGLPNPESAPAELRSRPLQQTREKILSAKELAAAFSLQYNPNSETPAQPKTQNKMRAPIAAGVLLLIGTGVVMMNPTARGFVMGLIAPAAHSPITPAPASVANNSADDLEHFRPDWAMKPPVTPPADSSATPAAPAQQDSSAQTPITPPAPAPDQNQAQALPQPQPQPQPDNSTPAVANVPAQQQDTTPPDTTTQNIVGNNSGQDLDALAMRLRSSGLDAEARHDFAAAQYFYEQIEKMPKEHWPADTDSLLKNAQKMNQSAAGGQQ
jgi:rubrerythrin